MPTNNQKEALVNAINQLRSAETLLLQASRSMADTAKLIRVSMEYSHLDSYLSMILHAQALTDDNEFKSATATLKNQATSLAMEAAALKKIINDVKVAGEIAGGVSQAVAYIATL